MDLLNVPIQAVIFDMDGVLVDSEPLHIKAEKKTLTPYGIELSEKEINRYMGMGVKTMLQSLIKTYKLPLSENRLFRIHEKNLIEQFQKVAAMPNATELIAFLIGNHIKLALASSSSHSLINLVLKKLSLQSKFNVVVSGEEVLNGKPFPDIFLKAAELLTVQPDQCMVIEDSKNGVTAAKKAGMICIGFQSPNSQNQDISQADYTVHDLIKICDLVAT